MPPEPLLEVGLLVPPGPPEPEPLLTPLGLPPPAPVLLTGATLGLEPPPPVDAGRLLDELERRRGVTGATATRGGDTTAARAGGGAGCGLGATTNAGGF